MGEFRFLHSSSLFVFTLLAATMVPTATLASDCLQAPLPVISVPIDDDVSIPIDPTGRLANWINNAPAGSTLCFPANLTYRISSRLVIRASNLTIEGNNSKLQAIRTEGFGGGLLYFASTSGITVRNLRIDGAWPTSEFSSTVEANAAIGVAGANNMTFDNISMTHIGGDCLLVDSDANDNNFTYPTSWSSNITLQNSSCQTTGRNGVSVIAGRDIKVRDNNFRDIRLVTVDCEPDVATQGCEQIRISNNTSTRPVSEAGRFFSAATRTPGGGDVVIHVTDVSIINNTMVSADPFNVFLGAGALWENIVINGNQANSGEIQYTPYVDLTATGNSPGIITTRINLPP